ncbi:MFS transporter [Corynebacterium sp. CNJ-954]|uniref:MFS transporter n=1 Tax=Corynebacterium sp. CNJ-954 TaxID=1904962 RepID=UPI000A6EC278|nr:MFS transporter [Corynebacterium sp. CNJ-954]
MNAPSPTQPNPAAPTVPPDGFRIFLNVLVNTAVANITTSFLWFALTFWIYAETRNVIATGVIGASYMLFVSVFSMLFGTLVDRFRKKDVMVWATLTALTVILLDIVFFFIVGEGRIADLGTPWFWVFAVVLLAGAVVEQLRNIALSTTVTLLVPEERRANANGLVGTVQGMAMLVTSVFSGLSVGFLGMGWTLLIGVAVMALTLLHLVTVRIPEHEVLQSDDATGWVDIRGGWLAVIAVPGLLALVLFTTLNNLFGGVQMALMDPYGIDLFGVQGWGIWFAVASTGLFVGGGVIAKWGLGGNPIRTMLLFAGGIGVVGALMTLREWGWLFVVGIWLMMAFIPAVEAAEQTVIQKVVLRETGQGVRLRHDFRGRYRPGDRAAGCAAGGVVGDSAPRHGAGRPAVGMVAGDGRLPGHRTDSRRRRGLLCGAGSGGDVHAAVSAAVAELRRFHGYC